MAFPMRPPDAGREVPGWLGGAAFDPSGTGPLPAWGGGGFGGGSASGVEHSANWWSDPTHSQPAQANAANATLAGGGQVGFSPHSPIAKFMYNLRGFGPRRLGGFGRFNPAQNMPWYNGQETPSVSNWFPGRGWVTAPNKPTGPSGVGMLEGPTSLGWRAGVGYPSDSPYPSVQAAAGTPVGAGMGFRSRQLGWRGDAHNAGAPTPVQPIPGGSVGMAEGPASLGWRAGMGYPSESPYPSVQAAAPTRPLPAVNPPVTPRETIGDPFGALGVSKSFAGLRPQGYYNREVDNPFVYKSRFPYSYGNPLEPHETGI